MKFGKFTLLTMLTAVTACGLGFAKPAPPSDSSTNGAKSSKEKHWTGILVDVGCMSKTLGADNMGNQVGSVFNTPHLIGWGAALPPKTLDHAPSGNTLPSEQESFMPPGQQQPGQPGQQGSTNPPVQRGPEPMPGTMEQLPDPTSAAQTRATKVNDAAKVCAASPATEHVGLATGEGQVLQFDRDGNVKAREALKTADIQPGKKIKAKVSGTLQDKSTVIVASIELRGISKQALLMANVDA